MFVLQLVRPFSQPLILMSGYGQRSAVLITSGAQYRREARAARFPYDSKISLCKVESSQGANMRSVARNAKVENGSGQ
jgi:hypothetical protein